MSVDQTNIPRSTGKPPCERADAFSVLQRLRDAGHVAYFAGGCVRDALLGLDSHDYDIATDALPDRVRTLFSHTQAVGQAFGVILVRHRQSMVEVATFRSDGRYDDGRRPVGVTFTTPEQDAQRRDFTINGLFFDPIENRVIDFVGGQDDLRAGVLRAIGKPSERFAEDYLRLLRAVRFTARFGLTIEPETAQAIRDYAGKLKQISPERIAEELRLILTPPTRVKAWKYLQELGLAKEIFRQWPGSAPQWPVFDHLAANRPISFSLALATALVAQSVTLEECVTPKDAKEATRGMRYTLKISNDESDNLEGTLSGLFPLIQDTEPTLAKKKRFLARPTSGDTRLLMSALTQMGVYPDRFKALLDEFETLEKTEFAPTPLITGDDLRLAGLTPGRAFRKILDDSYDAQLEGRVTERSRALELAVEQYRSMAQSAFPAK